MKLTTVLFALFTGVLLAAVPAQAQNDTNGLPPEVLALASHLKYQQGEIDLRGGLAQLTVPPEFNFLNAADTETVLVKLWGNPPQEKKSLGMLIPAGMTPLSSICWVVTIDYDEDGYVKDNDAGKINYDDLLKQMQKSVEESNKIRREKGYPTAELLGWAAPPHYDAAAHKLYWAKRLKIVNGENGDTLQL